VVRHHDVHGFTTAERWYATPSRSVSRPAVTAERLRPLPVPDELGDAPDHTAVRGRRLLHHPSHPAVGFDARASATSWPACRNLCCDCATSGRHQRWLRTTIPLNRDRRGHRGASGTTGHRRRFTSGRPVPPSPITAPSVEPCLTTMARPDAVRLPRARQTVKTVHRRQRRVERNGVPGKRRVGAWFPGGPPMRDPLRRPLPAH
jgi:hypothetical protein